MSRETQAIRRDLGRLAEDARGLMEATADVAGEKVGEARKRLAAALERGKEVYNHVSEKVVECTTATDEALHAHPYQAIGVALGVGALVGYLAARRCSSKGQRTGLAEAAQSPERSSVALSGL